MPKSMYILPKLQSVKTGQMVRQILRQFHCAENEFRAWNSGHWLGYSPLVISQ